MLRIGPYCDHSQGKLSGVAHVTWDKENRLLVDAKGNSSMTSTYDGDSRKHTEVVGATTSTIVWDGDSYLQIRS
jgi:hypothetical protein